MSDAKARAAEVARASYGRLLAILSARSGDIIAAEDALADAVKLTEANRNTLKQHFRNLVARGHLDQHGSGRGVWYGLG